MKINYCIRRDFDNNNHSVFKLNYYMILFIKHRKKILTDFICEYLKRIFIMISSNYKIDLIEMSHNEDHLHITFTAQPDSELSKFINAYKSASARKVKNDFPEIKEKLYQNTFWSKSYCLVTINGASKEALNNYIKTQDGEE